MKIAALYGRQSSKDQSDSLSFQHSVCMDHVKKFNYKLFTGHCYGLGTTVEKNFGGEYFEGSIIDIDEYYKICYHDGDCEDMTHSDVSKLVKHKNPYTKDIGYDEMVFDIHSGLDHNGQKELHNLINNFTGDYRGVGKQFDVLIVYRVDRFGRNVSECSLTLEVLRKKGIVVETAEEGKIYRYNNDPYERSDFMKKIVDAQQFSDLLSIACKQRRAKMIADGHDLNPAPYGWMKKKIDGIHTRVINPDEQKIIIQVNQLVIQHLDYKIVSDVMNHNNIYKYSHKPNHSKHKKPWNIDMIRNLCKDKTKKDVLDAKLVERLRKREIINSLYEFKSGNMDETLKCLIEEYNMSLSKNQIKNLLNKETIDKVQLENQCNNLINSLQNISFPDKCNKRRRNETKYDYQSKKSKTINTLKKSRKYLKRKIPIRATFARKCKK